MTAILDEQFLRESLRAAATSITPEQGMLERARLGGQRRRVLRRTLSGIATAAVAAAAVGVAVHGAPAAHVAPVLPGPTPSSSPVGAQSICERHARIDPTSPHTTYEVHAVTCVGGGSYSISMDGFTLSLRLPPGFPADKDHWAGVGISGTSFLWLTRNDAAQLGYTGDVQFAAGVLAARYETGAPPDLSVAPGAAALADWVSTRAYLQTSRAERLTVGGRPAWAVDAKVRAGTDPPPGSVGYVPLLTGGLGVDIVGWSRFIFLDLPAGKVAAIMSRVTSENSAALAVNQPLIDSVTFSTP